MKNRRKIYLFIAGLAALTGIIFFPIPEFNEKFSNAVFDRNGNLLGASISDDGQWRFEPADSVPENLKKCILLFEDQYFYFHPGLNPASLVRAVYQNLAAGKIVSGASTITMQVARIRYNKSRSLFQKLIEIIASLKLELFHSKEEILNMYVSYAPYGGNTVGVQAAAWRYYNRPLSQLSWAENALLAVLPNDPSSIFPGKSDQSLKNKRDRLLGKLLAKKVIDSLEYKLSVSEPIPPRPRNIPTRDLPLLETLVKKEKKKVLNTFIDPYWQNTTHEVLKRHHSELKNNGIENVAAFVISLESGKVLSYVGNTSDKDSDGYLVDILQSPRSSGSLLKPLLFALAIEKGMITPKSALPDVPTFFAGFTPKNFNEGFDGIVNADEALARSLNIPFVYLLRDYNYEQFQLDLRRMGLSTIQQNLSRYGLSLVLGGAEVTAWDVASVYYSLYTELAFEEKKSLYLTNEIKNKNKLDISPSSIWHMFNAMTELSRPGENANWESFSSSQRIAWKTGTSFGFRDAWAVGLNGKILSIVWVGNADGEGRAGLVGSKTAGPILLELMNKSDYNHNWLDQLKPQNKQYLICSNSGKQATAICERTDWIPLPSSGHQIGKCDLHKQVLVDATGKFRVNSNCYPVHKMTKKNTFIVPTYAATYYKKIHPEYESLPPLMTSCQETAQTISMIYPTKNSNIYIPKGAHGKEKVILQASHAVSQSTIYWHIDDIYLGSSRQLHEKSIALSKGTYQLRLLDDSGNELIQEVTVISE
jgi:penicillin-binding protein 1C